MRDHFLISIRSADFHESLANGKSSTQTLKQLISGKPVKPFKYRTVVQVRSFVPRTRFTDIHPPQKKGQRLLRKPPMNCVSSPLTLSKKPIRRRIVSTKASRHLVPRRRARVCPSPLTHDSLKFTSIRYGSHAAQTNCPGTLPAKG